jgi:hypothetical protein
MKFQSLCVCVPQRRKTNSKALNEGRQIQKHSTKEAKFKSTQRRKPNSKALNEGSQIQKARWFQKREAYDGYRHAQQGAAKV